jgi:hypothetical protein
MLGRDPTAGIKAPRPKAHTPTVLDVTEARHLRHRAPVENGQGAGQPDTDRTDMSIGLAAECGAAATENLRGGQQLGVDFEADNRLKHHGLDHHLGTRE